uniref:Mini-chromosome maintenance complex-binding protein n=1 Tax=Chrysotila carterae TaxID=13221 RepID=A0A6S9S0G0_CHRCT
MQSVADRLRTQPLMLVAEAFTASNDRRTGRSTSIQHALESCLRDESGFRASVPSLNVCGVHNIAEGGLVRFVGMIQDVRDTEFYAGIYEEHMTSGQVTERTGKYRDVLNLSDGATFVPHDDCTWQRTPMVCVPVPGLTTWAMEALVGPVSYPNDHRQPLRGEPQGSGVKRRAEPEFATGDQLDTGCVEPMEDDDESTKRPRSDAAALMCPPCADTKPPAQSEEAARKLIWERSASGMGCLLKVYDADEGEAELRVNDVVEVFGVVERGSHAEKAANDASAMEMLLDHERALQPPPSCQPRLHCFYVRRLPADCHPLLPEPNTKENALAYDGARAHAANLRGSIIAALSSALGGDKLVAEYVLLSSISRILVRHGEKPIGKLSVNITGCPPCANGGAHSPVTAALGGVLQELLPYAITMGMSIGELNSRVFGPFKDHEANALKQGCLQLPTGAVLLLDETVLAPGQLREQGVRNVRALADLLERQKVAYDFTYCR